MNQPRRVHARRRRQGRRRQPARGDLQQRDRYEVAPHVPGRLHGRRLPRRLGLRGRDAAGPARPLPPARLPHPVHGRGGRRRRSRSSSATSRRAWVVRQPAGQVRRDGAASRRRAPTCPRRSAASASRRQGRGRDPDPRLDSFLVGFSTDTKVDRAGHRARRRPAAAPATCVHLRLGHDGRASAALLSCSAPGSACLVAPARHARDALVPARCGGRRASRPWSRWRRLGGDRGRPPAVDRLRTCCTSGRGHRRDGGIWVTFVVVAACSTSALGRRPRSCVAARDGAALARGPGRATVPTSRAPLRRRAEPEEVERR